MSSAAQWLNAAFAEFDYLVLHGMHMLAIWGGEPMTVFFKVISLLGEYGAAILVVAAVMTAFRRTRKAGICMIVAVLLGAALTVVAFKNIVARPRPFADPSGAYYEWWLFVGAREEPDFSFPSGHVTAVMAGVTAAFIYSKKRAAWAGFLFVILMGMSRTYLMVHYPSDVLAGIVVGAIAALAAYAIVEAASRARANHRHRKDVSIA